MEEEGLGMNEKLILQSQKNEVFILIERRYGLAPSEFEWVKITSEESANLEVSALSYKPSNYYFLFDFYRSTDSHFAHYSPGEDSAEYKVRTGSWQAQREEVDRWLRSLKREIEAPDLWGAIAEQRKVAEAASSPQTGDTPFTPEEQEYIAGRIGEIKQYLSENLPPGQRQAIEAHLNELVDASRNMGRRQWMIWTVGTVVNTVIQYGIQSNVANHLLRLVYSFFGHLLTGGTPPLPLGA